MEGVGKYDNFYIFKIFYYILPASNLYNQVNTNLKDNNFR